VTATANDDPPTLAEGVDPTDASVSQEVDDLPPDRADVRLIGRVSGLPERRVLPSGDEVVVLRVVVRRGSGAAVDTLDVTVGPAPPAGVRPRPGQTGRRLLAAAERLEDGQRVAVDGQLRRRWWGGPGGRRSRVEVRAVRLAPA
jgi:single-strand DNA-binding protein